MTIVFLPSCVRSMETTSTLFLFQRNCDVAQRQRRWPHESSLIPTSRSLFQILTIFLTGVFLRQHFKRIRMSTGSFRFFMCRIRIQNGVFLVLMKKDISLKRPKRIRYQNGQILARITLDEERILYALRLKPWNAKILSM